MSETDGQKSHWEKANCVVLLFVLVVVVVVGGLFLLLREYIEENKTPTQAPLFTPSPTLTPSGNRFQIIPSREVLQPNDSVALMVEMETLVEDTTFEWHASKGQIINQDDESASATYIAPPEMGPVEISVAVKEGDVKVGEGQASLEIDPRKLLQAANFDHYRPETYDCVKYYLDIRDEWHLQVTCPAKQASSYIRLDENIADFELETKVRKVEGSDRAWYGIYLSTNRTGEQHEDHRFLISGMGTYTYEIATFGGDTQVDLDFVIPSTTSRAVNPRNDLNELRIRRKGKTVWFWVNDELLVTADSLPENQQLEIAMAAITPSRDPRPEDDYVDVEFISLYLFEAETETGENDELKSQ